MTTEPTLTATVSGTGPRVVLVHGFSQTRDCLGPLATGLATGREVVCVDAPGHGGSAALGAADLWTGADALVRTGGAAAYVGYSMGARLCLHAAIAHPGHVSALVLIGGTAGIEDDAERAERARADEVLARRLERDGVDGFVEEWLALEMFAGLPDWARFVEQRRSNTAAGLAASLRHAGTGTMEPLWSRLGQLRCPVLCLTGALDPTYGERADRMVAMIGPNARHERIAGAGHAAHLEAPDACTAAIGSFLHRVGQPPR